MTNSHELLKEKHPEIYAFVNNWTKKYSKAYDLSQEGDQADFYEGILEMARHIALNSKTAGISLELNVDGVDGLSISCIPQRSRC
jgi:hypothetical protein